MIKALRTKSLLRKDLKESFLKCIANEWHCFSLQLALKMIDWARKVQSVLKNSTRGKATGCVQLRAWDIHIHKWLGFVSTDRKGSCDLGWAGSPEPPCTSAFRAAVFFQPLKSYFRCLIECNVHRWMRRLSVPNISQQKCSLASKITKHLHTCSVIQGGLNIRDFK